MTSLLSHTVACSTRLSFRPKTSNQSIKKKLSLAVNWVKVVKKWQNSDFQSQFSMSKMIWIFLIFFSIHLKRHWIFRPIYFLKRCSIFDVFYSTDLKNFNGIVVGWPKRKPGQKWGHTKKAIKSKDMF